MSINDTNTPNGLPEVDDKSVDDLDVSLVGEDLPEWAQAIDYGSPSEMLKKTLESEDTEEKTETPNPDDDVSARIEAARAEARAEVERAAREREDRLEQQMLAMEKRNVQAQRDAIKTNLDALDLKIDQAYAAASSAEAEGDIVEKNRIARIARDLEEARRTYAQAQTSLPSDAALDAQFQEYRRTKKPIAASSDRSPNDGHEPNTEAAKTWVRHNPWFNDPKYAGEVSYIRTMSEVIAREGIDAKSPAHMDELTKRVHKRFPDLPVSDMAGRRLGVAPARSSGAPPVASARGATGGGVTIKNGKAKVGIDGETRAWMKRFGVDPNDKRAQQYWGRSKIETALKDRSH